MPEYDPGGHAVQASDEEAPVYVELIPSSANFRLRRISNESATQDS